MLREAHGAIFFRLEICRGESPIVLHNIPPDMKEARMKELHLREIVERSVQIREKYHLLENKHHGSRWSIEEDALAFLSDAGLVGRLTMSQQGRWPSGDTDLSQLKHKLAESIWWLVVLSERMDIDIHEALESFLSTTNAKLPGED